MTVHYFKGAGPKPAAQCEAHAWVDEPEEETVVAGLKVAAVMSAIFDGHVTDPQVLRVAMWDFAAASRGCGRCADWLDDSLMRAGAHLTTIAGAEL